MARTAKEVKGSLKEATGKVIGSEQMQTEGRAEKYTGRTRRKVSGAAREAKGALKEGVGKVTGADDVRMEGKAEKRAGRFERS